MIRTDSRLVTKGDTFIALRGLGSDGHSYIESAIKNGADKIICEEGNYSVSTIIVPDTRKYLASYLKDKDKTILEGITFIGITGTNGKTTSAYLASQILNKLGSSSAYIGTIGFYINNKLVRELNNTTPDLIELYEMFEEAANQKVKNIVMEVSSHAIELGRILGIKFDIVAFTNLTQDHLDFHKTMENYMNAKIKLFREDYLKDGGYAVINSDDPHYQNFMLAKNNNVTYGFKGNADYRVVKYELFLDKSEIVLNDDYHITLPIPGKYNIYNYLLSLIISLKVGYSLDEIIKITSSLVAPPGRFEVVKYKTNTIVIDYAHTPDGVLNIIKSALEYKKGKIITIIGCGGDRDKTKRPIMGSIASSNSDYTIFTDDNPRTEDEKKIMKDILEGVTNKNYEVIYDRIGAIHKGIDLLKENDILLILGKGHENYQIIGTVKHHLDDKEEVVNYLKEKYE